MRGKAYLEFGFSGSGCETQMGCSSQLANLQIGEGRVLRVSIFAHGLAHRLAAGGLGPRNCLLEVAHSSWPKWEGWGEVRSVNAIVESALSML